MTQMDQIIDAWMPKAVAGDAHAARLILLAVCLRGRALGLGQR